MGGSDCSVGSPPAFGSETCYGRASAKERLRCQRKTPESFNSQCNFLDTKLPRPQTPFTLGTTAHIPAHHMIPPCIQKLDQRKSLMIVYVVWVTPEIRNKD